MTNIRRITIKKDEEQIQTNTYILTFNKPHTLKKVNIGYGPERIEQYIPAPLKCFKCQKYGHHREACRGRETCAKCGEKDPDHMEEDSLKEIRCPNCQQDHTAYSKYCNVYKKEKEILEVKYKKNITFLETRKIIVLHGRKHLHLCCTEGGSNQS